MRQQGLRIAFYLAHYPKPGGTSAHIKGLADALGRAGCEVEILCQAERSEVRLDGLAKVRAFRRSKLRAPFVVPLALVRYLRSSAGDLDLIVLVGQFHADLPVLAAVVRDAGIPYVVGAVGLYSPAIFAKHQVRKEIYWHCFEEKLLEAAAGIQVSAALHEVHLRNRGIRNKTLALPIGWDVPLSGSPASEPRAEARHMTLGYLGRIDIWTKGLDILLEALSIVRREHENLRLVLRGPDSGDKAQLIKICRRLNLDDVVDFEPPVYGRSSEIISQWDVLVLPSRHEGFGLAVTDAMAASRPVLCSAEAGVCEHVHRAGCGVVVDPSVSGIARGISILCSRSGELRSMGAAGRAYLERQLDWTSIGERAARMYGELVRNEIRSD